MLDIKKLRRSHELKGKICEILSVGQIEELAQHRAIPVYELVHPLTEERTYWFVQEELNEWLRNYFTKFEQHLNQEICFMNFEDSFYSISTHDRVPDQLLKVKRLYRLPSKRICTPPGIYFLCNDTEIVYVGQAADVGGRIIEHKNDKKFDKAYFTPCHLSQLLKIETACIKYFKPKYNRTFTDKEPTERDKEILENYIIYPKPDQLAFPLVTCVPVASTVDFSVNG